MNDEGRRHSAPATIEYPRADRSNRRGRRATCEVLSNPLERASEEQLAELDRLLRMSRDEKLLLQVERLADDVGRLRRRIDPETSLAHLAERIANHIESIFLFFGPGAAEIARLWAPGDDEAVDEAIRIVEARWQTFRGRIGRAA